MYNKVEELDVGDREVWHCIVKESVYPFEAKKDTQKIWIAHVTNPHRNTCFVQESISKLLTKGWQGTLENIC